MVDDSQALLGAGIENLGFKVLGFAKVMGRVLESLDLGLWCI